MPGRLPEKTRAIARKLEQFRAQRYCSEPLQQAPVKEGQEIDVVINEIGKNIGERLRVKIVKVMGRFAIAEKLAT